MAKHKHQFTTPVGRLIGGSVYVGKTENYDGGPLVVKEGPNKGQPRVEFSFGVAFPKTPGAQHWANEGWLQPIWNLGHAAFPNGEAQRPDFAWKITDGDSTVPKKGRNNQPGKRPCDLEGHPGHWVIWFTSGVAPRLYNANGTQQLVEADAIKNGYYVQVCGDCTENNGATPGVYMNHSMVALAGFGAVISSGPDVSTAGFGAAPLPAGASATPPAGFNPVPTPAPAGVIPGPNSSYVSPPAPGGVTLPNAVGARVMSSKATSQGLTYESFAVGQPGSAWTDALLVQEGWMMAPVAAVPMAPPVPLAPAGSVPPPPGVAPIAVVPNPAFLQVGAPVVGLPPPPIAPPGAMTSPTSPQVTAKAAGMSFAQLMAMPGWNEQLLRQEGYIL